MASLFAHLQEPHPTYTAREVTSDPESLRVSTSLALALEGGGFSQTSFMQVTASSPF